MSDVLRGRVIKDLSGFFHVQLEDGRVVVCRLRGRLLETASGTDVATIGDVVEITLNADGSGSIEAVAERRSAISRAVRTTGLRGAGASEREQVLIANVDQVLFVFAAAQPPPSPRMIDRFLVMGEKAALDHLYIVLNKIDLDTDGESRRRMELYEQIGYTIIPTSARAAVGLDTLREVLHDKISVFTGPSGVGKTSLLNRLQPGLGRAVKSVSGYHQEGVHTTRDSELIPVEGGGYLADTPGLRTLTLWDVEPEELDGYFPEIAARIHDCRFADCSHRNEPGCAVRAAAESGAISRTRYESYKALRDELEAAYAL